MKNPGLTASWAGILGREARGSLVALGETYFLSFKAQAARKPSNPKFAARQKTKNPAVTAERPGKRGRASRTKFWVPNEAHNPNFKQEE